MGEILLFNKFFPIVEKYLRRCRPTKLCDGAQKTNFWQFLRPVFTASGVQYDSYLHPKFALRAHYVWKYGRHPICDG